MDSHKPIQATIDTLAAVIEKTQDAAGLPVRLMKLLTNVFQQWSEEKTSENLGSLTDAELLQKLAVSGSVAGALSTRETRKQARRVAAKIDFFEKLTEFGGVLKSQNAANVLGVTRQTINNHIKKGTLIAIQEGNDYLYPAFQFVGNDKLPHLEEILGLLKNVSAEAQCTFFLNSIALTGGETELPYVLLRNGATEQQLSAIKREAALFMSSTPS
ncbi:helix-turn-helix domain-containing protein [Pseudomonas sp. D(2018)]|uniref:helix-turn-helix domain-containing protein n=1 Tax=Pseudomonas sp. D(2018) TaxID=2502238 RepID=UPI0010F618C9|nr:helix-turn-helix domain-containing protein [Pseudomonas sp. D(2018)]